MKGWITLHRQLVDWEWYTDANTARLFIHCLLKANHEPKSWRGINIERGQFFTSLESLSSELGLTKKQIRTAFSKLKKTQELASKGQSTGRLVTVTNYDLYQEEGKQKSNKRQAKGKQRAATNNDNNDNNEESKKKINPLHKMVIETYNEILPELPAVRISFWKKGTDRYKNLCEILKEDEEFKKPEFWKWYFSAVRNDNYYMGRVNAWKADFEFLVRPEKFIKIAETYS